MPDPNTDTSTDPGGLLSLYASTGDPGAAGGTWADQPGSFGSDQPAAPAAASAAPSAAPSAGPVDFIGKLGNILAGGPAGITTLSPEQTEDTGRRALMNFGLSMLQGAGPSYTPRSFGQILAGGLGAAQETETASEQAAAVRQQASAELGVQQQQVGIQQQEAAIKLAQFKFQMELLQRNAALAAGVIGGLTGANKGGAAGASGASAAAAPGSLFAALPKPNAQGDISGWKDPGSAQAIVQEAQAQGVDPNIALAVAYQESGGNPAVAAGDGGKSTGLFQVQPDAAASVGVSPAQLATPAGNIRAGVGYLKQQIGKYGDVNLGITAYNAGPETADAVLAGKAAVPPATLQYIANVHNIAANNPARIPNPSAAAVPAAAAAAGVPPPAPAPGAAAPGGPAGAPAPGAAPGAHPLPPSLGGAPAATGPGGAPAPGFPSAKISDYPDIAQNLATEIALEASKPDANIPALIQAAQNQANERAKVPVYRTLSAPEAQNLAQGSYNPRSIYQVDQFGHLNVQEQTPDPVRTAITTKALETLKTDYEDPANSARNRLTLLDQMDAMSGQVAQDKIAGRGGPLQTYLQPLTSGMSALGITSPAETGAVGAEQAYGSLATQLATQMSRSAGISRLTQFELEQFVKAVPSLQQTVEGRQIISGVLRAGAQRQIDNAKTAEGTFYANNGTLQGLDDKLDAMPSIVPQAPAMTAPATAHAQFAAGLRPGAVFKGPDGQFQIFREPGQRPASLPPYRPGAAQPAAQAAPAPPPAAPPSGGPSLWKSR